MDCDDLPRGTIDQVVHRGEEKRLKVNNSVVQASSDLFMRSERKNLGPVSPQITYSPSQNMQDHAYCFLQAELSESAVIKSVNSDGKGHPRGFEVSPVTEKSSMYRFRVPSSCKPRVIF